MSGQFVRFFRVNPYGPEKHIADEVMGPVAGRCPDCEGTGLQVSLESAAGFDQCPTCDGTGRIRLCSAEEFERRRQFVIERAEALRQVQQPGKAGGAQ